VSEKFLNGTSANSRLFSARKCCENVIKEREYNQGYLATILKEFQKLVKKPAKK